MGNEIGVQMLAAAHPIGHMHDEYTGGSRRRRERGAGAVLVRVASRLRSLTVVMRRVAVARRGMHILMAQRAEADRDGREAAQRHDGEKHQEKSGFKSSAHAQNASTRHGRG